MMASELPLIVIRNVSKKFNTKIVLNGINLKFNDCESIGLLGKSGAGKSVLVQMIKGIRKYKPDEGNILFHVNVCPNCLWVESLKVDFCPKCHSKMEYKEIDLYEESNLKLREGLRSRIAIMFQRTFGLYGNLTALDNIMEALRNADINESERYKKAAEILQMVNLMHRSAQTARDLSGGEKQRLVLARQIAKNPLVLLADEPTGTLDPKNSDVITTILSQIKNSRLIIVTSHFSEIILKSCEKSILLDNGKIIRVGKTKDLVDELEKSPPIKIKIKKDYRKPIIKLTDVKKYYYKLTSGIIKAVDIPDFKIEEGSILAIIGESGAGKTTLSKIISGIIQPTNGYVQIRVGEKWIKLNSTYMPERNRATRNIGILFQEYLLFPYLTVFENLAKSKDLGIPAEFVKLKVIHVLKSLGFTARQIGEILEKYPDELSEGEKHRVALAWVLMKDPRILILDEPSGTMDVTTKGEVSRCLKKLKKEFGTTIILISHDIDFALQTCDKMVLMQDGKIKDVKKLQEVTEITKSSIKY